MIRTTIHWRCECCDCEEFEIVYAIKHCDEGVQTINGKLCLKCARCGCVELYNLIGEYFKPHEHMLESALNSGNYESETRCQISDAPRCETHSDFVRRIIG